MTINNILFGLMAMALSVGWGYGLWNIARAEKSRKWLFYVLLALPIAALISMMGVIGEIVFMDNVPFSSLMLTLFVVVAVLVGYVYGWGLTLWEHAGEDRMIWYIITLIFSPLWIVWQIGKLR